MNPMLVFPAGVTEAIRFASTVLHKKGIALIDHPAPEITHLLLDIPSFSPNSQLRSGADLKSLLERLPETVTVIGGNLNHPALADHKTLDLLTDEYYLARNAAITADCALRFAAPLLKTSLPDTPALVIGWGRIGKCLAQLLKAVGTPVWVAARKEKDRAALQALGYQAVGMDSSLNRYRLILNTVPEVVFPEEIQNCSDCVKINLASRRGLTGEDVIHAKNLPGRLAPESTGQLIGETILRLIKEDAV